MKTPAARRASGNQRGLSRRHRPFSVVTAVWRGLAGPSRRRSDAPRWRGGLDVTPEGTYTACPQTTDRPRARAMSFVSRNRTVRTHAFAVSRRW